jgi:hypothetical protein
MGFVAFFLAEILEAYATLYKNTTSFYTSKFSDTPEDGFMRKPKHM